ncbi:hypothetical protein KAW48_09090, partial [candidate division WOR-3 bacterium]|nr:hypothetical protein [candidate division WOR-3 bacterium]
QCSLSLPDSFYYNDTNLYTITLSSEGDYLPPGKLLLTGKDYFDSLTINRSLDPDTTLTFNYQPDEWHTNDWIKADLRYGNQMSSIKEYLPFAFPAHCPVAIRAVPHDNTFLPGDTARFSGWLRGRGKLYGAPVIGWVANCPPGGDTLYDTVVVNPGSNSFLSLETFIDTTIPFGEWYQYYIGLKYLNDYYDGTIVPGYRIHPPVVKLNWLNNDTLPISDSIPITYSNPIKTTARVRLDSIVLYNNKVYHKDIGPGEVSVHPESSYTYWVDIPDWTSGEYKLKVYYEVTKGEGWGWGFFEHGGYWRIFIEGVEAQFSVQSEKDWFNVDDDITINSLLHNGDFAYMGGVETLFVYPFEETTKIVSLEAG